MIRINLTELVTYNIRIRIPIGYNMRANVHIPPVALNKHIYMNQVK